MNESLIDYLLGHIDTFVDPVFSLVDLPDVDREDWLQLQKDRLIVPIADPDSVQIKAGQWLSVRKTEHGIFGLDESEEFPKLIPLSESDLLQYRLNFDVFCRCVCALNGFKHSKGINRHGFYTLGRKTLGEHGTATVYLSMPNGDADSITQRLRMLVEDYSLKVVVFPRWPDVDAAEFATDGLHIADLQSDLSIEWPAVGISLNRKQMDEEYAMIRKGGSWTIHYLGETIHPGAAVGLGYIAKALQKSPEPVHLTEWEQDLVISDRDQRDSGGLEARAEPNQNLEATTRESAENIDKAIGLFEAKLAEAQEIEDEVEIQKCETELARLKTYRAQTTFRGRPKVIGNESLRKRLTKNLGTAYKAIDRKDTRIGKFIRDTVIYKNGELTHEPAEGESWDVRIY